MDPLPAPLTNELSTALIYASVVLSGFISGNANETADLETIALSIGIEVTQ